MSILDTLLGKRKIDPETAKALGLNQDGKVLVEGKTVAQLQQEGAGLTQQMNAESNSWPADLAKAEADAEKRAQQAREIEAHLSSKENR